MDNISGKPKRRKRLRDATNDLHKTLESRYPFSLLTPETFTSEVYRQALDVLWGFYKPMEDVVREPSSGISILKGREKSSLLAADLLALGTAVSELPTCTQLPRVESQEEALGIWYVFEGATLGGSLLLPVVQKQLGPDCGATNFYGVYGEDRADKWRAFCRYLEERELSSEAEDRLVGAAMDAFRCLITWTELRTGNNGSRDECWK